MDILFLLIPLSVALVFVIGVVFWLAVDGGQFDDLDAPALRIIADDDTVSGTAKMVSSTIFERTAGDAPQDGAGHRFR